MRGEVPDIWGVFVGLVKFAKMLLLLDDLLAVENIFRAADPLFRCFAHYTPIDMLSLIMLKPAFIYLYASETFRIKIGPFSG